MFQSCGEISCRPSSSELANGRLPPEIQYWVAVVMRNACRKDDFRGRVRQCADHRSTCSHKIFCQQIVLLYYPLPSIFLWTMFIQCCAVGGRPSLENQSTKGVGNGGKDFGIVARMLMKMDGDVEEESKGTGGGGSGSRKERRD